MKINYDIYRTNLFCKTKDVQGLMKLDPTVSSNLKFYMNKKHIDHRGVNNDVQTKHKNIFLVACKSLFNPSNSTKQRIY